MVDEATKARGREHLQRMSERPERTAERLVREEMERLGFAEVSVTGVKVWKVRGEDRFEGRGWAFGVLGGVKLKAEIDVDGCPTREAVPDAMVARAVLVLAGSASIAANHERSQANYYRAHAAARDAEAEKAESARSRLVARLTELRAAGAAP